MLKGFLKIESYLWFFKIFLYLLCLSVWLRIYHLTLSIFGKVEAKLKKNCHFHKTNYGLDRHRDILW